MNAKSPSPAPDRPLLYFDILGFRNMIRNNKAEKVREVIRIALDKFDMAQCVFDEFETIYFSDTILFYLKSPSSRKNVLKTTLRIAQGLYNLLLANGIPVSGALAYGPFSVDDVVLDGFPNSKAGQHRIYFGPPLVEAYEAEKENKWLGVMICPSAVKKLSKESLEDGQKKLFLKAHRDDKGTVKLLLNPFADLVEYMEELRKEREVTSIKSSRTMLLALGFLLYMADTLAERGEFVTNRASRYFTTLGFLRKMLPPECFDLAADKARELWKAKGVNVLPGLL